MVQVARSIESSAKEQEKNRDERLKILLDAERKRDELFYAHQREQAEANRRHEMLLAQLLTRGSTTYKRIINSIFTTGPKSCSDGPYFQYSCKLWLKPSRESATGLTWSNQHI